MTDAIRLPAERRHAAQLQALIQNDEGTRPPGWVMSPRSVETFVLGSRGQELEYVDAEGEAQSVVIDKKFYGDDVLVERAIVTLASDRGLLLVGEPGTAKSWLSEHLAAAISGDSMLTIQGTAGLTEDMIKYSWNYAQLLAEGPGPEALVPAPLYSGMKEGKVVRFEEITRTPHEVQDTLISCMSDKVLIVPELPGEDGVVLARRGFNVVATANTRDRGVNEMSSALKRRFNFETVHPVEDLNEEVRIVRDQVAELMAKAEAPDVELDDDVLELLVTTFHELRSGRAVDGTRVGQASSVMSTAEAVSVGFHSALFASYFGQGRVLPEHVVINIRGTAVKDADSDLKVLQDYWDVVVKARAKKEVGLWRAYFEAREFLK